MNRILNLTQHAATPEQLAAGVVDLEPARRAELQALLTFEDLPTADRVRERAERIAELAVGVAVDEEATLIDAMIGGAPFLMAPLERTLWAAGIRPLYAFSKRESIEEPQPDGSVRKTNVFRHVGFVEAAP